MGEPSVLQDFLRAPGARKLRYILWSLLGVAIAAGTVWVVVGIVRLHLLLSPGPDAVDEKLQALQDAHQSAESARSALAEAKRGGKGAEEPVTPFSFPYEIKAVAVPIANHRLNKALYMQFTIIYDCPSQKSVDLMGMSRAKLRSMLYETALQFNEDDFRTPEGFDKFRNELLGTMKAAFGEAAPRSVALKDVLVN